MRDMDCGSFQEGLKHGRDARRLCPRALSNPDRLRVPGVLVRAGPTGLGAGKIAADLGASPSRTSFHLPALAGDGFVRAERPARTIRYGATCEAPGDLLRFRVTDRCADAQMPRDVRFCGNDSTKPESWLC